MEIRVYSLFWVMHIINCRYELAGLVEKLQSAGFTVTLQSGLTAEAVNYYQPIRFRGVGAFRGLLLPRFSKYCRESPGSA